MPVGSASLSLAYGHAVRTGAVALAVGSRSSGQLHLRARIADCTSLVGARLGVNVDVTHYAFNLCTQLRKARDWGLVHVMSYVIESLGSFVRHTWCWLVAPVPSAPVRCLVPRRHVQ